MRLQWTRAKIENLLTTFALAFEALVERSGTGFVNNGKINVKALADYLSGQATKANGGEVLPGQSAEAIKDRIEAALKAKRERLPGK